MDTQTLLDTKIGLNLLNPFFLNQCRIEADPTWNDSEFKSSIDYESVYKFFIWISESFYVGSVSFRHWFQKIKWLRSWLPSKISKIPKFWTFFQYTEVPGLLRTSFWTRESLIGYVLGNYFTPKRGFWNEKSTLVYGRGFIPNVSCSRISKMSTLLLFRPCRYVSACVLGALNQAWTWDDLNKID